MTVDHRPAVLSETRAIIARGGRVLAGRVNGMLALSRSIGDGELAKYITCEPHVSVTPFREECRIIIAIDGVWDVNTDQETANIFNACESPAQAAQLIRNEALRRGTLDNVSVSCVDLSGGFQKMNGHKGRRCQ
jgi:serine/threonine protein phosphatase PrpC